LTFINRCFTFIGGAFIAFISIIAAPAWSSPLTIKDDLGRVIPIPHGVHRIVCLSPSATETLFAVGAGSKVVAVDQYSNYPAQSASIPKLDGLNPSRERLVALHPDLIILSDQTMTLANAQAKQTHFSAPLFVTTASSYSQAEADIAKFGVYFGDPRAASKVVERMQSVLSQVQKKVRGRAKPTVFDIIWSKPLMTAGRGTFIANLIELAGGRDIAADAAPYSAYPLEKLLAKNPQIILTGDHNVQSVYDSLRGLGLTAVTARRVYGTSEDLTVRPGPRLADGLLSIAKIIHPEAFRGK